MPAVTFSAISASKFSFAHGTAYITEAHLCDYQGHGNSDDVSMVTK